MAGESEDSPTERLVTKTVYTPTAAELWSLPGFVGD